MKDPRPNILLLHTDQQRFDTIAALGGDHVLTPNLDRLAQLGKTYTRAYSSSPICMPARHDLITGTSARYHGYYTNQGQPIANYGLATVPRLLTAGGYQTFAVGKMHFRPAREHHGFQQMFLMEEIPASWEDDAYVQFLLQNGQGHVRCQHGVRPIFYPVPQVSRVPEAYHGASWVADQTIDLICRERTRPFFLMASWVGPHPPFYVPQRYLDMYADAELPPIHLVPEAEQSVTVVRENDVSQRWVRRFREGYFARITLIDRHVGRILDALEDSGQIENTLIVFMTDHGEMAGDRRHFSKGVPYEGSAHIPLIVAGPGVRANTCADVAVNTWDVAATVLDAAGVGSPEDHPLIGSSLFDLESGDRERIVLSHLNGYRNRWIAAISSRWKLVHYYLDGREELYDLDADPWEQSNLIHWSEHAPIAASLRQACIAFEEAHGLPGTVSDGALQVVTTTPPVRRMHNRSQVPWPFNWTQFPHWMNGHSDEDHKAILYEMRDILKTEGEVLIPADETWREMVLEAWDEIGGRREDMLALFREADGKRVR